MTFNYITNIPLATNNPSTDQPNMKQDTNSINSWVQTDHIGFNVGTAGQHAQVTFNANQASPAIQAGATAVEYINAQSGVLGNIATLFFKNATKDLPLTNLVPVSTTPGATGVGFNTPWGLIINMGFGTSGTGPTTFTFQIPMNNAQYTLVLGVSSSDPARRVTSQNFAQTTFQTYSTNANTGFYFLAIGA